MAGGVGAQHRGAIDLCQAVNLLNEVAGNVGKTVRFGAEPAASEGYGGIQPLFDRMAKGEFQVVLVHDANPLYTLPKSGKFAEAFAKVPFKVSTAAILDETAAACDLILPNLHGLERWDDLTPRAGVSGLMQPVIEPVRDGMHTGDVLLKVSKKVGGAVASFNAAELRGLSQGRVAEARSRPADFDTAWREALGRGGIFATGAAGDQPRMAGGAAPGYTKPAFDGNGDYVFMPYPSMQYHDGRGANKPWLLENPDPITKITWQSWVEIHPGHGREARRARRRDRRAHVAARLAARAGLRLRRRPARHARHAARPGAHRVRALRQGSRRERARPARRRRWPGIPAVRRDEGVGRAHRRLSQGGASRWHAAPAGPWHHPVDAGGLRREGDDAGRVVQGGRAPRRRRRTPPLERTALEGWHERSVEADARSATTPASMPKWGMAVDLSRCTGCSACVTACYAENNIPTVGEEQVFRRREMSWMRIERYWEGGTDGEPLQARFSPVMCQHCDNAPCEPVCPVYAAYHTPDGLNGQVYNRCVGTRYCSNNCPFKVRYFNWLKYNEMAWPEPLNLQLNPDVTVRARGVMEKCTFCIQRIRGAQHTARLEDRDVRDGEVVTACAQACPSERDHVRQRQGPDGRGGDVEAGPPRLPRCSRSTNVGAVGDLPGQGAQRRARGVPRRGGTLRWP